MYKIYNGRGGAVNDINQTEVNLKKWASEKEGNTDTPKEKTVGTGLAWQIFNFINNLSCSRKTVCWNECKII